MFKEHKLFHTSKLLENPDLSCHTISLLLVLFCFRTGKMCLSLSVPIFYCHVIDFIIDLALTIGREVFIHENKYIHMRPTTLKVLHYYGILVPKVFRLTLRSISTTRESCRNEHQRQFE